MDITSDCVSAWQAIENGVVAETTKDRQKHWYYWCDYANICTIDPFLSNISCLIKRDVVVTVFAARFRSDMYGKNATIKF